MRLDFVLVACAHGDGARFFMLDLTHERSAGYPCLCSRVRDPSHKPGEGGAWELSNAGVS
jgi:hypothetical protein